MVTKCSFRHNLTEATSKQNYLTKVVKEYVLIQEMSWRSVNRESFGQKTFILSQPTVPLTRTGSLVSSRARFLYLICHLLPNDSIFSGLHDIFCIRTYSLTTFVKEVF